MSVKTQKLCKNYFVSLDLTWIDEYVTGTIDIFNVETAHLLTKADYRRTFSNTINDKGDLNEDICVLHKLIECVQG